MIGYHPPSHTLPWRRRLRASLGRLRSDLSRGFGLRDAIHRLLNGIRRAFSIMARTLWRAMPFVFGAAMMALLPTAIIYGYRYVKASPHFRVQHVDVSGQANVSILRAAPTEAEAGRTYLWVSLGYPPSRRDATKLEDEMHAGLRDGKIHHFGWVFQGPDGHDFNEVGRELEQTLVMKGFRLRLSPPSTGHVLNWEKGPSHLEVHW